MNARKENGDITGGEDDSYHMGTPEIIVGMVRKFPPLTLGVVKACPVGWIPTTRYRHYRQ